MLRYIFYILREKLSLEESWNYLLIVSCLINEIINVSRMNIVCYKIFNNSNRRQNMIHGYLKFRNLMVLQNQRISVITDTTCGRNKINCLFHKLPMKYWYPQNHRRKNVIDLISSQSQFPPYSLQKLIYSIFVIHNQTNCVIIFSTLSRSLFIHMVIITSKMPLLRITR